MIDLLKKFKNCSKSTALVIGDVILDEYLICSQNKNLYLNEKIPTYRVNENKYFPGGAANVAQNIAELGINVILISVIGDQYDSLLLESALNKNVNLEYLVRSPSVKLTKKTRIISNDVGLAAPIVKVEEYNDSINTEELDKMVINLEAVVDSVDYLILSDYGKGVLDPYVTAKAIQLMTAQGKKILVDPRGNDTNKYRGASVITPNFSELIELLGVDFKNVDEALDYAVDFLYKQNIEAMILKVGNEGSYFVQDGSIIHCPPLSQNVQSTVGAGDSLMAGFSVGMVKGMCFQDAFILGNLAAAVSISKPFTSIVSRDEIYFSFFNQKNLLFQ